MAPLIAVATSLEHLTPSPTWPLLSPIATKALKRVRWPALVCFCTGMILSTSSFRAAPRKKSMISNSCGRAVKHEGKACVTQWNFLVKLPTISPWFEYPVPRDTQNAWNCLLGISPSYEKWPMLFELHSHLDGKREQVDVLQGLDLQVLHQTTQLGDWHPLMDNHNIDHVSKVQCYVYQKLKMHCMFHNITALFPVHLRSIPQSNKWVSVHNWLGMGCFALEILRGREFDWDFFRDQA